MKRPFLISFIITLLSVFIILLLQNGDTIEIEFFFWRFNTSIALLSLISLILGLTISSIIFFPLWLRKRFELKKSQQELVEFLKANSKSDEHLSEKTQDFDTE